MSVLAAHVSVFKWYGQVDDELEQVMRYFLVGQKRLGFRRPQRPVMEEKEVERLLGALAVSGWPEWRSARMGKCLVRVCG